MKKIKILFIVVISFIMLAPSTNVKAIVFYEEEGTFGTCSWGIENGVLHIAPNLIDLEYQTVPTTCTLGEPKFISNSDIPGDGFYQSEWVRYASIITSIDIASGVKANTDSTYLFSGLNKVKKIVGIENLDTENVTNMNNMFSFMETLESINLSNFDTSKVTDMSNMFSDSRKLKTLNLSSLDTSKVTNMSLMFSGLNISTLDIAKFDTSNVITMYGMFEACPNLFTIYAGDGFITTKVTDSEDMFDGAISIMGGNGTTYNASITDKTYARADATGTPGYFTYKIPEPDSIKYSSASYNGMYDENEHGITVNVTNPTSGVTITYSTSSKGTYTETKPTYTDVGTYTTYFKIEAEGCLTVTGSQTVTITKKSLSTPTCPSKVFNGEEQTLLSSSSSYTVEEDLKGTDIGKYQTSVTPTGNYKWSDGTTTSKKVTCKINAYDLNNATIEAIPNQIYTGNEIIPIINVTAKLDGTNSITLIKDTDYTISYSNNIEIGTATVTITGIGSFTGTKTTTFTISSPPIIPTEVTVTINANKRKVFYEVGKTFFIQGFTLSSNNPSYNLENIQYKPIIGGTYPISEPGVTRYTIPTSRFTIIEDPHYTVKLESKEGYLAVVASAPKTMKAALIDYRTVKLTWSKIANANGYKVYYKRSTSTSWTEYKGTRYSSGSYRYAKIKTNNPGSKYDFRVKPYIINDGKTTKGTGKTVSTYTLKKMKAPKITKISSSKIRISYIKINGASGYEISKSTKKTGTNVVSKITVKKGVKYYYKVRAYKIVDGNKIKGLWSNVTAYTLR